MVAFLALAGDEVDHLYVHPDQHRQGLGTALLLHAQEARKRLELWVFQRNTGAVAFYEAHGFAIVGGDRRRQRGARTRFPDGVVPRMTHG